MGGIDGTKRHLEHDALGHLVPPGALTFDALITGVIDSMEQRRYSSGHGIPSVPTRYVVTMNPADRAWFDPSTEDRVASALHRAAERAGFLVIGGIEVAFETDAATAPGRPLFWAGFAEDDLLVLAGPSAVVDVFARA